MDLPCRRMNFFGIAVVVGRFRPRKVPGQFLACHDEEGGRNHCWNQALKKKRCSLAVSSVFSGLTENDHDSSVARQHGFQLFILAFSTRMKFDDPLFEEGRRTLDIGVFKLRTFLVDIMATPKRQDMICIQLPRMSDKGDREIRTGLV
jgi:hypothetical protein